MMKQHNKIILLVEDEAPFQEIYRDILESEGYDIVIQETGEGALEWLEYNTPDLVLLDIILPKISGIDVLTQMRQTATTQNTPVVVYSVIDDQEQIDNAMKLGANNFMIKGQTAAYDVLATVNELLGVAPMAPKE
jgi:DNA-binding response OmpR family regulator